jgi:N-acetylglucosaminyldiphosphoundecaprenol N-acetyl-beta-D-mannosaminyltransferase
MSTVNMLGFNISNAGLHSNVLDAFDFISKDIKSKYMACANPHSLVEAFSDDFFKDALNHADILLPDGAGIILAANILKLHVPERVAGTEFFLALTELCNKHNDIKIFFLGSTEEVLNKLVERIKIDFPNVTVCGVYSPPFKAEFSEADNDLMVESINAAKPNILWVGMTAPKQEKWILANKDKLDVNFIGAIGAVFDFYAGTKKRAPQWICKMGLEWLPRLLREPKRLWKRNFVSTPLFLYAVFKQKLFN